jgi:hypothetical protein
MTIVWTKPYPAKYWCIDISKWNEITQSEMNDMVAHGLAGVWIQSVNAVTENYKLVEQIDMCRKAGVPYGVYTWLDPTVDVTAQVNAGIKSYKDHAQDAKNWLVDMEQEHVSQVDTNTAHLSASVIYSTAKSYTDLLSAKITIPIGIYSGPNYLNNVCEALKPMVKKFFYVNASYGMNEATIYSWAEFAQAIKAVHASWIPTGFAHTDVDGNQWTSNWQIRNDAGKLYDRLDFDAIQSDDVYKSLFGSGPVEPPPPPPPALTIEERVTKLEATVKILAEDHGMTW